jgi:hypothetical protein
VTWRPYCYELARTGGIVNIRVLPGPYDKLQSHKENRPWLSDLCQKLIAIAALAGAACAGHPASPSAAEVAPARAAADAPFAPSRAASALPPSFDARAIEGLGLDADYVRDLVYTAEAESGPILHSLERWEVAILRHCVAGDLAVDRVAEIAAAGAAATGIPAAVVTGGPCEVRWVRESGPGCGLHPCTGKTVVAGRIVAATIYMPEAGRLSESGLHELGHALAFSGHSPRRGDLMYATPTADYFSASELAVLARLYPSTK